MAGFRWTPQAHEAAELVARDDLTNQQIAERFGVTRQALDKWKAHPEFKARVAQHVEEYRETVRSRGIGLMERRVAELDDRWKRLRRVIDQRAADPAMEGVPGGDTGLMVATVARKFGKDGADGVELVKYELDAVLLRELRDHEKQAAQELGQWAEKKELSGPNGGPINLAGLTDHDLDAIASVARKLAPV
jgi:hypothetical protein